MAGERRVGRQSPGGLRHLVLMAFGKAEKSHFGNKWSDASGVLVAPVGTGKGVRPRCPPLVCHVCPLWAFPPEDNEHISGLL